MARVNTKSNAMTTYCRACHSRIRFSERPELYDIVVCPECDEEFEVIRVSPIQIDWLSDFEEEDGWFGDVDEDDQRGASG